MREQVSKLKSSFTLDTWLTRGGKATGSGPYNIFEATLDKIEKTGYVPCRRKRNANPHSAG